MLVGELDDVTYDLEVDGEQVRRTLHRRIWQRGGWATVALVYQERAAGGDWKPARLVLIRFQRVRDAWKKHAAITLHGGDARELGEVIAAWRAALEAEAEAGDAAERGATERDTGED